MVGRLTFANFKRSQVILRAAALASDAHILLQGVARITCRSARDERVTIALLPPGPIPEFPSLPLNRFDFRCEAYSACRIGSLTWNELESIAAHRSESAFKTFHKNDLQQCYQAAPAKFQFSQPWTPRAHRHDIARTGFRFRN